ncbi:MAG: 2'-5' RNA ligase family protein [Marmoricola sp.]
MQVHLGVLVPTDVAEAVTARVAAAAQAVPAPDVRPRRRLFGRAAVPVPPTTAEPDVAPLATGQVQISIAAFGNLPTGEVHRLGDRLEDAAAGWPAPRVRVAGLDETDQAGVVAVALGGEVEELREVARGVTRTAEGLGLFVDRRRFRPAVVVARAAPGAGPEAAGSLSRVRAALRECESAPWTVEALSLLRIEHDGGVDRLAEVRRLPLGGTS